MSGALNVLVLAGERRGRIDPMAVAAGVSAKALIEIGGVAMLGRVVGALRVSPSVGRIYVTAQDTAPLLAIPGLEGVEGITAAATPATTVAEALARLGAPLLVTTADHALLSPAMVEAFIAGVGPEIDAAAGVAGAETIRREFPDSRRTWLRFRDGDFSGCNLFLLATPRAAAAVSFWQRIERHRKAPLRMAWIAGPLTLLLYASRLGTLDRVVRLLGRRAGARLAAVVLPFARAAVDVDKPDDLRLVRSLLEAA